MQDGGLNRLHWGEGVIIVREFGNVADCDIQSSEVGAVERDQFQYRFDFRVVVLVDE